jgi:hypothetical protein
VDDAALDEVHQFLGRSTGQLVARELDEYVVDGPMDLCVWHDSPSSTRISQRLCVLFIATFSRTAGGVITHAG